MTKIANGLKKFKSTSGSLHDDLLFLVSGSQTVNQVIKELEEFGVITINRNDRNALVQVKIPDPKAAVYTEDDARNDGMSIEPTGYEPQPHSDLHPEAQRRMQDQLAYVAEAESLGTLGISKEAANQRRKGIIKDAQAYSKELHQQDDRWKHVYKWHPHELEPVKDLGKVSTLEEQVANAIAFQKARGRDTDPKSIAWCCGVDVSALEGLL